MISRKQKLRLAVQSFMSLVAVFASLHLLKWALVMLGAYISEFDGIITLKFTTIVFSAANWNSTQVLWMYFFPYLGLLLIYIVFAWPPKYPVSLPAWLVFLHNWAYLLILVVVFFNPLLEVISHNGIYHPLNWLYVNRSFQLLIGILMWMILVFKMFRIAALFSRNLIIAVGKQLSAKQISIQLIYLWLIPFFLFFLLIFIATDFTFLTPDLQLLSGIFFLLLANTWLIRRYQVIVN